MEVKIFISGDYCPIGRNSISIEKEAYDKLFGGIDHYSKMADLAITNLECPITDGKTPIYKTGPNLRTGEKSLLPLKFAGINMVTLANNHIFDYGEDGLNSTISACIKLGIEIVGAGKNIEVARQPYKVNIKGIRFTFLNFTENEFCTAKGTQAGANPIDIINNHYDIAEAKKDADYVIVISHGGREHFQLPTPKQRERFRFFINSGADVVVGHHPHCFGGYEIYKNKPIFYSLGNFIFDYKKKYQKGNWTKGFAVNFTFTKTEINFEIIPFHQGREQNPNIVLYNESEKIQFNRQIDDINKFIIDDILFIQAWEKYIKEQTPNYMSMLVFKNKYVRFIANKGWLPKILMNSKAHHTLLLNMFRCETHREIMIDILKKRYELI